MKFVEQTIKVNSIHYKLSPKTKKLSAFKIQYTHGIQTPLIKAKDETDNDMQTVMFTKKQFIAKLFTKRLDKNNLELQFIDANDNIILRLPCYQPLGKDE